MHNINHIELSLISSFKGARVYIYIYTMYITSKMYPVNIHNDILQHDRSGGIIQMLYKALEDRISIIRELNRQYQQVSSNGNGILNSIKILTTITYWNVPNLECSKILLAV